MASISDAPNGSHMLSAIRYKVKMMVSKQQQQKSQKENTKKRREFHVEGGSGKENRPEKPDRVEVVVFWGAKNRGKWGKIRTSA